MQVIINRIVFIVMILAIFFAALSALISLLDFDNDSKYDVGYLCGVVSVFFCNCAQRDGKARNDLRI